MRFERKYKVNNNFFNIWSHDMAYILGFWWADGNIYRDIFSISQKKSDEYILKNILSTMESDYPIHNSKSHNNSSFAIRSKEIIQSITKIGGTERKSKTCGFPNVPKEYMPDFIRGVWDGDGCITRQTGRKSYFSALTSGSKKFVEQTQDTLRKSIHEFMGGQIFKIVQKKGKKFPSGYVSKKQLIYYDLRIGVNDTKRLGYYMYNERCNLKLERKYKIFKSLTPIINATYNKKYVSYKEAKEFASKLGIKTWDDWKVFSRSGKRPEYIPSNPNRTYRKEFKSIKNFLGVK